MKSANSPGSCIKWKFTCSSFQLTRKVILFTPACVCRDSITHKYSNHEGFRFKMNHPDTQNPQLRVYKVNIKHLTVQEHCSNRKQPDIANGSPLDPDVTTWHQSKCLLTSDCVWITVTGRGFWLFSNHSAVAQGHDRITTQCDKANGTKSDSYSGSTLKQNLVRGQAFEGRLFHYDDLKFMSSIRNSLRSSYSLGELWIVSANFFVTFTVRKILFICKQVLNGYFFK